jgi:hypothetical protein
VLSSLLAAKSRSDLFLLPAMANRHGHINAATGAGKTVTLQNMAEESPPWSGKPSLSRPPRPWARSPKPSGAR